MASDTNNKFELATVKDDRPDRSKNELKKSSCWTKTGILLETTH